MATVPDSQTTIQAIALTEGDLLDNETYALGGLIVLSFLEKMRNHLYDIEKHHGNQDRDILGYVKILKERIQKICGGLSTWILRAKRIECGPFKGCFYYAYYPDGEPCYTTESYPGLLVETAVRIMMLKCLMDVDSTPDAVSSGAFQSELSEIVRSWIVSVDEANQVGLCVFPCFKSENTIRGSKKEFLLSDHIWIWRALGAIQDLGYGDTLRRKELAEQHPDLFEIESEQHSLRIDYTPDNFRSHVLRRFTVNYESKAMVALALSSSGTRLGLIEDEPFLLYQDAARFFTGSSGSWNATLDFQNDLRGPVTFFSSPLHRLLVSLMREKDLQANHMPLVISALQGCFSTNGLAKGRLNSELSQPNSMSMGYQKTTKLSYDLWTLLTEVPAAPDSPVGANVDDAPLMPFSAPKQGFIVPKNVLMDNTKISDIQDEWLYDVPDFLEYNPTIPDYVAELFDRNLCAECTNLEGYGIPVSKYQHYRSNFVFDIAPKRTAYRDVVTWARSQNDDTGDVVCENALYLRLQAPRSLRTAKKRWIWIRQPTLSHERLCCSSVPASDRPAIERLFDNHDLKSSFFIDEVSIESNRWVTELTLSWLRFIQSTSESEQHTADRRVNFLGDENSSLEKSAIGCSFIGDFFDRYWTCHVLGRNPTQPADLPIGGRSLWATPGEALRLDDTVGIDHNLRPFYQRKVLELALFDIMLRPIIDDYNDMFTMIGIKLREILGQVSELQTNSKPLSLSSIFTAEMDNRIYSKTRKKWPQIQYTLQIMEEDLSGILDTVRLWKAREEDRGLERPRWTQKDESRYRRTINKLLSSNNAKVREIEGLRADLRSLQASLTTRLESSRDNISFEGSQNIQYFTYVTIVFLPLGFATGIFSMSGAPNSATISGMAVSAVVTLAITALFIVFAQMYLPHFRWDEVRSAGRDYGRGIPTNVLEMLEAGLSLLMSVWDALRRKIDLGRTPEQVTEGISRSSFDHEFPANVTGRASEEDEDGNGGGLRDRGVDWLKRRGWRKTEADLDNQGGNV